MFLLLVLLVLLVSWLVLLLSQHTQDSASQPQGQASKVTEQWHHLPVQVSTSQLPWGIHRGIWQGIGGIGSVNISRPLPQSSTTGHPLDPDCFSIIHKDIHSHSRTIKEAMFIRVNDPMLSRNLGNYQLLHVWDSILQGTPMLQLKPSSFPSLPTPFPSTRTPPLTQSTSTPTTPSLLTPGRGPWTFLGIICRVKHPHTPPLHEGAHGHFLVLYAG